MEHTTQTFDIKGMHCASCAGLIEKTLTKSPAVMSAEVNVGTETARVMYDATQTDPETLSHLIEPYGYSFRAATPATHEHQHGTGMNHHTPTEHDEHAEHTGVNQTKEEKLTELAAMKFKLTWALPLAALTAICMAWNIAAGFGYAPAHSPELLRVIDTLMPLAAFAILATLGMPYVMGVVRFAKTGVANMDSLVGIGTITAFVYSLAITAFGASLAKYINVSDSYYDVTIIVITLITLGKYLEARAKLKTGDAIEKLLALQAKTALVLRAGKEVETPIEDIVHDDIIVVKPGGKIPVDGVLVEGNSYVDESMISGEPMPVEKTIGASLASGTINTTGSFTMRATKVGSETLLAHIIAMVAEAQSSKAPIQTLADEISAIFVPAVLVISFLALGAWIAFGTSTLGFATALSLGLTSFVGILVIACPCALGLATPTAIIVGVGKGAREGILIKDAATLEKLHEVNTLVMDKTGTITKGKPEVVSLTNASTLSDDAVLRVLASLESRSEHPLAHAITAYASTKKIEAVTPIGFEVIKGKGVRGTVDGVMYVAGNETLMREEKIAYDATRIEQEARAGKTPIMLAGNGTFIATVMVADAIKPEAKAAVADLAKIGITVVMLTGDNAHTARAIAHEAGIKEVIAEVLPADKRAAIQNLQSEGKVAPQGYFHFSKPYRQEKLVVAMAGDGINDAPALAQADVGIAMATGTDVAIESAGITLLHGDISKLVKAVRLSKITMNGIRQNLFWAFIYNIIGIPLAAGAFYPIFGWTLNPIFAGLAMGLSSVSVVTNSLRIKTKKL